MPEILHLRGFVRHVKYNPMVRTDRLKRYDIADFDINRASPSGIIDFDDELSLPYSTWLSPKPSRSFPSARMYKTYHLPKPLTIIPILRDEGSGSQNNDRFTFASLSRMNLLNVHIVLGWNDWAIKNEKYPNRVKDHLLNSEWVMERIREIRHYKLSAHHWNEMHFERDYEYVYRQAVQSYQRIGQEQGVVMNPADNHLRLLEQNLVDGKFNIGAFRDHSSPRSTRSAKSEAATLHDLEYLRDGGKAIMELRNILGGRYSLTADEVYWERGQLVIQESKNSRKHALPSLNDIQDGLFKNILFMCMEDLYLDESPIQFKTRLKLTGVLNDSLSLPVGNQVEISDFSERNQFTQSQTKILGLLQLETEVNPGLSIEIAPNK